MGITYYEASIICKDGSVIGGSIGGTPEEADAVARALINSGEMFPEPVRVRLAKCEYISEQPAFSNSEE